MAMANKCFYLTPVHREPSDVRMLGVLWREQNRDYGS